MIHDFLLTDEQKSRCLDMYPKNNISLEFSYEHIAVLGGAGVFAFDIARYVFICQKQPCSGICLDKKLKTEFYGLQILPKKVLTLGRHLA